MILLLAAASFYYYVFIYAKTHHRDAQSESSIIISADALSSAYQENEQKANSNYLNKVLEVKGAIVNIDANQAGHPTLILGNASAMSNVSVTLISKAPIIQKMGDTITVKGICTGSLSDVILNEGVIK